MSVRYYFLLRIIVLSYLCLGFSSPVFVYVYDCPNDLVSIKPDAYTHHRRSYSSPDFFLNNGAGRLIDEEAGFYFTHQYSLYTLFLERLRQSSYITTDPNKATYFFIPYDIGTDSTTRKSDGALSQVN